MKQFISKLVVVIGLLSVIAGALAGCGGQQDSYSGHGLEKGAAEAANQLRMLIDLGDRQMEAGGMVTVKLQGELINHSSLAQARIEAKRLASAIGLAGLQEDQLHGNEVYGADGVIAGISIAMSWAVTPSGDSYVRVMLTEEEPENVEQMIALQQKVQREMAATGIKADWNASIQGFAEQRTAVSETIHQVEQNLAPVINFQLVEDYEDLTTVSRSYKVPDLPVHVMSGRQPIQMQIAVHEDSMNEFNRITIGFPVITVEY